MMNGALPIMIPVQHQSSIKSEATEPPNVTIPDHEIIELETSTAQLYSQKEQPLSPEHH